VGDCGEAGPKGGHLLLVRASYEACASGVHVGAGGCSKLTASAHCDRPTHRPGSEAKIKGYRPSYYVPYNGATPYESRVNQVRRSRRRLWKTAPT
jgi:hypothetical protein